MKICKEIGCGKKYFGAGLCSMHYSRLKRHRSLETPIRIPWNKDVKSIRDLCREPGCPDPIHSRDLKFCKIHYNRFRRHGDTARRFGNTGCKASAETIAKRVAKMVGRTMSVEQKLKRSIALKGRIFSQETKRKMRQSKLGTVLSESHVRNILANQRRAYIRPEYAGIKFRSTYEVRLAKAFDKKSIAWIYEPTLFNLGTCNYLPDFYLPQLRVYWEAKGYFWPKSKNRVALFRVLHPDKPLIVATTAVIEMMEQ